MATAVIAGLGTRGYPIAVRAILDMIDQSPARA
jgi:3-dehydroquinate dehydratase-2